MSRHTRNARKRKGRKRAGVAPERGIGDSWPGDHWQPSPFGLLNTSKFDRLYKVAVVRAWDDLEKKARQT